MIENSDSEDSASDNELNEQEKIRLDPVKADNLNNGFNFGQNVSFNEINSHFQRFVAISHVHFFSKRRTPRRKQSRENRSRSMCSLPDV